MTHLRVEDAVEQINEQVDQEVHDQHEQDKSLDWRKIVDQETLDGIASDTGQRKYHLHEYDPTNEKPHLQTDKGDHRHEGIFQGELVDDGPRRYPIGVAHQNELGGQDLAHGGIRHAGDRGPRDKGQRDEWEYKMGGARHEGLQIAREHTVEEV